MPLTQKVLKRFEIYQETTELFQKATSGQDPPPYVPDRDVSSTAIIKITISGEVPSASQGVVINGPGGESPEGEVVDISAGLGVYWSTIPVSTLTQIGLADYNDVYGFTMLLEQYGKDRSPITQRVSRSAYVYGSLLAPQSGGIYRSPAGQLGDADTFELIVPSRWGVDCGIQKKDWIKDSAGVYYRVTRLETFPDGHLEILVQRAK